MGDDLKHRFKELIEYINEANSRVLDGQIHTLKDLEQKVNALCDDALSAEANIAKEMQPLMAETVSKLEALASNLIEFKKQHNDEDQT